MATGPCIDPTVGPQQRRLQEHAALKRLRVAHRGDVDVNAGARLQKCTDLRRQHDGCDILRLEIVRVDRDAVALQEIRDAAKRGGGIAVAVAGQTHHDTVTDQLVVTPALDDREILDS
jgi:hypothetical protein